ncbi:MAG: DNA polymerase III subunit alpha [Caldilineaceae bacterium]
MNYTHLHVHSQYSLLGATPTIDGLVERAVADGLTSLALTDTNALYGAVRFAKSCGDAGIQPLIGMALTVRPPADGDNLPSPEPLLLLAENPAGYRSLCRLSSAIQNHPEREERARRGLAWDELRENREGLLAIAGGRRSWLESCLRAGDEGAADRFVGKLAGLFDERAFLALEIQRPEDGEIARQVAGLGARFGLVSLAVQPVYTLDAEDRELLRLLAAMEHNCRLGGVDPVCLPHRGDGQVTTHWLSGPAMESRFADFPRALAATADIAARCQACLPDGRPIWPVIQRPGRFSETCQVSHEQSHDETLAEMAGAGLVRIYGEAADPTIQARLERELAAIAAHGFAPLFLLVADLVDFARSKQIPVSTRGSVANCLVAYCVGITDVDPVAHKLLFERFLNPARTELPDIDLDFCSRRRDEVLEYARERFGADRVALVATVSTFQAKSAVRETGKAYGLDEADIKRLSKLLPRAWHPDPRRRSRSTVDDLLAELDDPRLQTVVRQAWRLIGQPSHLSVHPGGLVATPGPTTDFAPLQWTPKGFAITQYDHKDAEAIGLVKVDVLGIRALTVLADAVELVRARFAPELRLETIPDGDPATAHILATGETIGVFQCESTGAQRTLRQLKAGNQRDLAVANAFFKPGPATGGMAAAFVRRYRGEEPVRFLHPALEPILGDTQGVLLFQEQILRLATEIAGLSWEEAEHLRRGMSKFRADEMEHIRARFVAGCQRAGGVLSQRCPEFIEGSKGGPGLSDQQARTLWEQVEPFAGYGFNQGHATAYAAVSYRSAYVKAHWPAEFLCARLADWGGFHHPAVYIAEAQRLGIGVRPPHVNISGGHFRLVYEENGTQIDADERRLMQSKIRENPPDPFDRLRTPPRHPRSIPVLYMGLGQVRELTGNCIQRIVAERVAGPFADLRDFLLRVEPQPKELNHLIRCGGLDGLGASRAELLQEAEDLRRSGHAGQMGFGFLAGDVGAESAAERLAWETELLGQPVSVHPVALVPRPPGCVALADLPNQPGKLVTVIGARLPGWTGGKGFFLDDGTGFVVVQGEGMPVPKPWQVVTLRGRWVVDGWGGGILEAQK